MATVISFVNNKGGVGKSTLACAIAQALAITGKKTLAIDNDGQHNLSTMLRLDPAEPNMENLYKQRAAQLKDIDRRLQDMTLQTALDNLHCITAPDSLCDASITNERILADVLQKSYAADFYDYVIIDNHPGTSALQRASLYAAQYVFIPTELQQLAVNGLSIMYKLLNENFNFKPRSIKIIPNKYRSVNRQEAFLKVIQELFPQSITTPIPLDGVFDELVTEGKILFLDRLRSSRAVPYIVKLITEIFRYREERLNAEILEERNKHLADNIRQRYKQQETVK